MLLAGGVCWLGVFAVCLTATCGRHSAWPSPNVKCSAELNNYKKGWHRKDWWPLKLWKNPKFFLFFLFRANGSQEAYVMEILKKQKVYSFLWGTISLLVITFQIALYSPIWFSNTTRQRSKIWGIIPFLCTYMYLVQYQSYSKAKVSIRYSN